jgi:hypothetical protein
MLFFSINCGFILTNIIFFDKITDIMNMKGMTISEMAAALNLPRRTVEMRIFRGGFKPISQEALYSTDVFKSIQNTPGRGRPKKEKK